MNEQWKEVAADPRYKVSNLGRLITPKGLATPCLDDKGYPRTHIAGKGKTIHTLVLEAFVSPKPKGFTCNHKNGDKTDNRLENLEWCSYSRNMKHAYDTGLKRSTEKHKISVSGTAHHCSQLTDEKVRRIKNSPSRMRVLAEKYKVSYATIYDIKRGATWKHVT